MQHSFLEKFKI